MTLGSLFDGVGGWQLAARRAGLVPLWSSEIDEFCMSVTRRHFPDTIQLGDINGIDDAPHVDIITAGSPCQDLSIAGKRSGINGERSGLFFRAVEIVRRIRPAFFVWENVPGVISVNGGKDFAAILAEIAASDIPVPECGFANAGVVDFHGGQLAYRILDAQYFGVPQRRRRIFLVADFAGRRAAQILFEPAGVSRDSAPRESSQQETAARIGSRADCAVYDNHGQDSRITRLGEVAPTVSAKYGTGGNNIPLVAYGLGRDAFNQGRNANFNPTIERELQPPLTARGAAACATPSIVRRLTPLECERLQGLPDEWTQGGSDAKRYKALGNGMAQPCADFILKRITQVSGYRCDRAGNLSTR